MLRRDQRAAILCNKLRVLKTELDDKKALTAAEDDLKDEKLNHYKKRIKLLEYAMEQFKMNN